MKFSKIKQFIACFFAFGLMVGILLFVSLPVYANPGGGGSGTAADPWLISTFAQLRTFRNNVNNGNSYNGQFIKLTADIDMNVEWWTPIGTAERPFSGNFCGAGYRFWSLTLDNRPNSNTGLFGVVNGIVRNFEVYGLVWGGSEVAGVVGTLSAGGVIEKVRNYATVTATGSNVGGIAGRSWGTVRNCVNSGTISSTGGWVGGIVGQQDGSISFSYNTGDISGSNGVGGISGYVIPNVTNCVSLGNSISASSASGGVGRIVGLSTNSTTPTTGPNYGRANMNITSGGVNVTPTSLAQGLHGTTVTLNSTPNTTVFSGWSGTIWNISAGNLDWNNLPGFQPFRTVTYNLNNGTGTVIPVLRYGNGDTVTVAGAGNLTRTGHTFNGWNTAANGSGTSRAAGATFAITANTTLFAQWAPNTYNVTNSVTNATISNTGTNTATHGTQWTGTLTANTGYSRPTSITMTRNGVSYTGFTYTSSTGAISIPAADVTAAFVISGAATLNSYTVTNSVTNATINSTANINHGTSFNRTLTATTGHTLPTNITVTIGGTNFTGFTYTQSTGVITIPAASVTGNIVISGEAIVNRIIKVEDQTGAGFTITESGMVDLFELLDIDETDAVTLTLKVNETDESATGATEILESTRGRMLQFFNITVTKQVNESQPTILSELPIPIQVIIDLSPEMSGKTAYSVYRFHGNNVELIGLTSTDGEYYSISRGTGTGGVDQIIINTKRFSTYAVVENIITLKNVGNDEVNVQARIVEDKNLIYRIDIAWGPMKFEFDLDADEWVQDGFDDVNNKITVTNRSNDGVTADFDITSEIDMEITAVENEIGSADTTNGVQSIDAFLEILGKPDDLEPKDYYEKIGIITVTITTDE